MGGLQKLITLFSGWVGLQKLITVLGRFYPYKGGVWVSINNISYMYKNDVGKGVQYMFMKLMKQKNVFFCYVNTSHRHRFCTYIHY